MAPDRQLHVSVKDMWVDDDGVACIDAAALSPDHPEDLIGYEVFVVDLDDPKDPIAIAVRSGRLAIAQRH